MKISNVLTMMNKEFIVKFMINFVMKDTTKIILSQEIAQINSIKDND